MKQSYQEITRMESKQAENQQALQQRINRIAQWAADWKMELHPAKSKVLHIGKETGLKLDTEAAILKHFWGLFRRDLHGSVTTALYGVEWYVKILTIYVRMR